MSRTSRAGLVQLVTSHVLLVCARRAVGRLLPVQQPVQQPVRRPVGEPDGADAGEGAPSSVVRDCSDLEDLAPADPAPAPAPVSASPPSTSSRPTLPTRRSLREAGGLRPIEMPPLVPRQQRRTLS
jgi:hypothetical protein